VSVLPSVSGDDRGCSAGPEINTHFVEFEGSLPCGQDSPTGPYPEAHGSVHIGFT